MQEEFVYTKYQTPRGAKPDAEVGDKLYLIKNVSMMRLTYQVKLLTYLARRDEKKLIVQLPRHSKVSASLRDFVHNFRDVVRIERS